MSGRGATEPSITSVTPLRHDGVMDDIHGTGLTISCDDCCMRCTAACDDCVVSFLLDADDGGSVVLDLDQARAVRLLGSAGLVPGLKYRDVG
ncbi:MAG: hypothetical protein RLZZ01_2192 [Actinomycetota bacterium]